MLPINVAKYLNMTNKHTYKFNYKTIFLKLSNLKIIVRSKDNAYYVLI